jgi:four helix bundle protein
MGNFKDLKVWQRSRELMVDVHRVTATLPRSGLADMAAQMRASSLSIPSNIAEGNGRQSDRDQARCYRIAQGSARELEAQLILLNDLEMLATDDWLKMSANLEEICKMISGLIRYCVRRQSASRPAAHRKPPTSDRSPPTSDRSPPTSDRSPPTSDRSPPTSDRSPPT